MSVAAAVLGSVGLAVAPVAALPGGSLTDVSLSLSAERSVYLLGEPVRLALTIRNNGQQGVWGFFALALGDEAADIQYRGPDGRFVPLAPAGKPSRCGVFDGERFPLTLEPREERTIDAVLGLHPATGGFLLDRLGEYELKLVARPRPWSEPRIVLETNVVHVKVDAPPDGEQAAFADYRRDKLVVLAQAPLVYLRRDAADLRAAVDFVARHRHGVYAQHVRAGLLQLLRARMGRPESTDAERKLYEELRAEAPGER